MLKIVSGIYGGRAIETPKGDNTRPTTNRAREAVFSSLTSILGGFDGAQVLDLFAGSGALGIEALSRGASHCTFVDNNRAALECVKGNLSKLGVSSDFYKVIKANSKSATFGEAFDLVFLDPPYAFKCCEVEALTQGAKVVYYEHSSLAKDFYVFDGYELAYDKEFGEVHSSILVKH